MAFNHFSYSYLRIRHIYIRNQYQCTSKILWTHKKLQSSLKLLLIFEMFNRLWTFSKLKAVTAPSSPWLHSISFCIFCSLQMRKLVGTFFSISKACEFQITGLSLLSSCLLLLNVCFPPFFSVFLSITLLSIYLLNLRNSKLWTRVSSSNTLL